MSTEEYIRDKRFECHGASIKFGEQYTARWYDERQLRQVLKEEDWNNTAVLAHHANFDLMILSHWYGIKPKFIFDTLSIARMLLGNHLSVGLDSLARHFNMQGKSVPYSLFDGKHWHELSPQVQQQVADGCCHDVELTWELFKRLGRHFPKEEFQVIDTTVRAFTEPVLRADVELLARTWESERDRKRNGVEQLDITKEDLQSADKFAALLEQAGVEIEYKDGKNGPIPCFAKNDRFMEELLASDDDYVRLLAETRLAVKSTILQTRCETFGFMAQRGPLPVYLRYCAAVTLRFGGGDDTNFTNLKRQDRDNPRETSPLRRALMAPEGFWLAPIDLAQIEARVLSYLADHKESIAEFARGDDPYIELASAAYGYKVTKEMKRERGTGKQLRLSCGYMAAERAIQRTARLGIYGPPVNIDLDTAIRWKNVYRDRNQPIVNYWKTAGRMIARLAGGPEQQWGPLTIRDKRVYLPSGQCMIYDTLEYHVPTEEEIEKLRLKDFEREGYWRVRTRQGWKIFHAGKFTQNICEMVSRVIVTQAMNRITAMGFRILNIPHDELLTLIPKGPGAERDLERCKAEMTRTPDWLPGLPLACDGELSDRYEK